MTPAESIGHRLQRARQAAGLSLRGLAKVLGVSHTLIDKYEAGRLTPNSTLLLSLAKHCGVKVEYFLRPTALSALRVDYRKHSRQSAPTKRRIEGTVLDQAERRLGLEQLFPQPPTQKWAKPQGLPKVVATAAAVEAVAEMVRAAWGLGKDPVGSLVDILELRGVRVFPTRGYEKTFDGLLMELNAGAAGTWPIILLDETWPGDRQRFTLAHELGHLLLRGRLKDITEEKACDVFAGAFLLPADVLKKRLSSQRQALEPRELYLVKHAFGVSMLCVVMRAHQVGIINDGQRLEVLKSWGGKGWRKLEPGKPIPPEQPRMFELLVYRALAEGVIGEAKAAEFLGLSLHQFHALRSLDKAPGV